MEKNLYIDASHPDETRVVLRSESSIEEYEYEDKNKVNFKNNIYLGTVSRVEPSLQAAFINFGRIKHGFLAFNDIQSDYYQIPTEDKEKLQEAEEKIREDLKNKTLDDLNTENQGTNGKSTETNNSNLNNNDVSENSSEKTEDKKITINKLENLVKKKDPTYSPLALYFIIDNKLIIDNEKINNLFDILIQETPLKKEIKNLIIYKKALFNSDFENENNLINILNPVINSNSVWKSHALYLMAEYFFDKNEKQKAKEFYNQILNFEKSNEKIVQETQKRLSRDFSE